MHLLIHGPSGVGKTSIGDWLDGRGYRHIVIDTGDKPMGVKAAEVWRLLEQRNFAAAGQSLDGLAEAAGKLGCVVTLWGSWYWEPDVITRLSECGIAVRYLYGPEEACIEAARQREIATGRLDLADPAHWHRNNDKSYERMGRSDLEPYRVWVFDSSGAHLSPDVIARKLKV